MGHPQAAEKDRIYFAYPPHLPHRQRHPGALRGHQHPGQLPGRYGHHHPGPIRRDERRRLRYGDGFRPGYPAIYQQLHHYPAADRGYPRSGADGP